jgi:hypothetical protein
MWTAPVVTDGQRAPVLRLDDRRAQVLSALVVFRLLPPGFLTLTCASVSCHCWAWSFADRDVPVRATVPPRGLTLEGGVTPKFDVLDLTHAQQIGPPRPLTAQRRVGHV